MACRWLGGRLGALLLGLTILLASITPRFTSPSYLAVRVDYLAWLSTLIACLTAPGVVEESCRDRGVRLSSILGSTGLAMVLGVRAASAVQSALLRPANLFIGGLVADPAIAAYTIVFTVTGLLLILASQLAVLGGHDPLVSENLRCRDLKAILARPLSWAAGHPAITAFTLGFLIRLAPELEWWPLPIGYDTVEYIAHLRDFAAKPMLFGTYYWMGGLRHVPPLLDWVTYPPSLLIDAWYVFKIYPPLEYGVLASLIALYTRRILGASGRLSLTVGVASALNLLLLRLSWDLQKQLLGTIMILAALIVMENKDRGFPRHIYAAMLLILAALATEFGAAIAILLSTIIILRITPRLRGENRRTSIYTVILYAAVIIASYKLILWYLRLPPVSTNPVVGPSPPLTRINLREEPLVYAYVFITYGSILPLLLAGLGDLKEKAPNSYWLLLLLLGLALTPWLTPYTALTLGQWDRVLMTASTIALPTAFSKLSLLGRRELAALYILFTALPGLYALAGPTASEYYNSQLVEPLKRMPPGLSPMPSNREWFNSLQAAGSAAAKLAKPNEPVLTSIFDERFVHLALRNPVPGQLVTVGWHRPQAEDICRFAHILNVTRLYVLTTIINETAYEESLGQALGDLAAQASNPQAFPRPPGYCGPYSVNNTLLEARMVYRNKLYSIYEVSVEKQS